jgi:hypothetical protein
MIVIKLRLFFEPRLAAKKSFSTFPKPFTPTPVDASPASAHNARNNHQGANGESVEPSKIPRHLKIF